MRAQLDETIRLLGLEGRVVNRAESMALVEFPGWGFLQVSAPTVGDHDAVIILALPTSVVTPQSLPELKRANMRHVRHSSSKSDRDQVM